MALFLNAPGEEFGLPPSDFRHCTKNVNRITNAELVDMYFVSGLVDGDRGGDLQMYRQKYPTRCVFHHQMLAQLLQSMYHLEVTSVIRDDGLTCNSVCVSNTLQMVDNNPR